MLGAIAGDIIGSVYEHRHVSTRDFPLFHPRSTFTDDSVLTVAVADAILTGRSYAETLREYARRYPDAGYGGSFSRWMMKDHAPPYHSWGNGSAMRVAAVGSAFDTEEGVLREAERSAVPTHDHPEGVKGAQAVALAILLSRRRVARDEIRSRLEARFGYDLSRRLADIRPSYYFDVSCQGSVPEAIICFLESRSWEDAVRDAVFLGGDSDTLACIAGAIAEAWYGGVPEAVAARALARLPEDLRKVTLTFRRHVGLDERDGAAPSGTDAPGQVRGPLESFEEKLPKSAPSKHPAAVQSTELSAKLLKSDYFKENVGFMPSDATDFSDLEPVEVEEVPEGDPAEAGPVDTAALEDLYVTDVEESRKRQRAQMRRESTWFHDNGREVEGTKHLAVSIHSAALDFVETLKREFGTQACIPDYLLFLDVLNSHASLSFFLRTADTIHINLSGLDREELNRATTEAGGPVDRKEALDTPHMALWLINQIYWTDAASRARWYRNGARVEPWGNG